MKKIVISDPAQLQPGTDLYEAMRKAEALTGASVGGTGPSSYVDDSGNAIRAALVAGDNDALVVFVPPGNTGTGTGIIVPVVTSADLKLIPAMQADMRAGGDMAASAHAEIGDIQFVTVGAQ